MVAASKPKRRTNMTDTQQTATTKSPSHHVYHVRDGKDKGYFTKVGAAWPHRDGNGFNLQIEFVPLDGRLTLRIASEKKE
jgi:hypothetical protein